MPAPDEISALTTSTSFYDWFNSYNNLARGKLNKIYVYQVYGKDGIVIQTDNAGGYTFSLGGTIPDGVTFSGSVKFTGTVTLPSQQSTTVESVSKTFSGNFISAGITLGNVVRVLNTGGLSLSNNTDRDSAESLGVVTSSNLTTEAVVTILGKISGTTLTSSLIDGGGVFSTGCVYFLSSTSGKVTTTETEEAGKVSKPILIATAATEAIVLPFRGQYFPTDGGGGAFAASIAQQLVEITPIAGETEFTFSLKPGAIMAFSTSKLSGFTSYSNPADNLLYVKYKPGTNILTPANIVGIVSDYETGTAYSSINGNNMVVQPIGSRIPFDDLGWTAYLKNSGFIYLNSDGDPTDKVSNDFIGIAANDNFLFIPSTSSPVSDIKSGSGNNNTASKPNNNLVNGSMSIWQRPDRGDISGWTSSATGGYFCDRWCIINNNPGGQTFTVTRKKFSQSQTDVLGYPDYYINIKGTTKGAGKNFSIENRTQDARTNAGKEMTISFYGRNLTGTGITLTPYVKQYGSTYTSPVTTTYSGIYATSSSWQRYSRSFIVPTINTSTVGLTFDSESYFAMGIRFDSPTIDIDLGQFILDEGKTASVPDKIDIDEEYKKCSYYYQRSYSPETRTGSVTYVTNSTLEEKSSDPYFNGNNSCGGAIIVNPVSSEDIVHNVKLPVKMRKSDYFAKDDSFFSDNNVQAPSKLIKTPPVTIYSPAPIVTGSGKTADNDALNLTAKLNIKQTQGTLSKGYQEMAERLGVTITSNRKITRTYTPSIPAIKGSIVSDYEGCVTDVSVQLTQGFVPTDKIAFHYTIDLDLYQGLV